MTLEIVRMTSMGSRVSAVSNVVLSHGLILWWLGIQAIRSSICCRSGS